MLALTVLTSSQSILIVWSKADGKFTYSITTTNFLVEVLKCALSLAALARIWRKEGITEDNRLSTTLREVWVYPVPAVLYTLKNLLQYSLFHYVDAPGYQGAPLPSLVQILTVFFKLHLKVVASLSGMAGVLMEVIIKKQPSRDINVQNFWLHVFGVILNTIAILVKDFKDVTKDGFFHGYSVITVLMILNQALSGIAVSMVLKYADNIMKVYSTSVAMLMTAAVSSYFFQFHFTVAFLLGLIVVSVSIYLHYKGNV